MTDTSAASLKAVFDAIPMGLAAFDARHVLRLANARFAATLGLPSEPLTDGLAFDDLLALLSTAGPDGAALSTRLRGAWPDAACTAQAQRWKGHGIDVSLEPLPDGGFALSVMPNGTAAAPLGDIRRVRDTESANQTKSRFLATMGHELLTPLNAIIGFSDALARDGGAAPAKLVSDYSGQINTAGKQLLSLINIVLDVARIESGRFEPDAEVVDIARAVRIAQRQTDTAAAAGQVSVALRIPDELPWLRGDERRITQMLSNVVSNAVKFTQPGGSVVVEVGLTEAQDLFVSVADTGIGIPEDELERVFQPFSQIDASLSRRYQGAGLGLFTARAVATAHGGSLMLTSKRGAGTTAYILLPRARLILRDDQ